MNRKIPNTLRVFLLIDALIALGFGLYSWLRPNETFGTIISIPENDPSVFISILNTLSVFYIVIGLICIVGFRTNFPTNTWIGLIMIIRHILECILKVFDIGSEWLIGNPYTDITIHSIFIIGYITAIIMSHKKQASIEKQKS